MIVGPEARGFIVGCPVAFELGIGFAPVRKPGKLPREVISADYEKSMVLIHFVCMLMQSNQVNVYLSLMISWRLVVPSKLQLKMIERLGGVVAGCAFLIELDGLNGRKAIEGYDTKVLMNFPG